MSEINPANIVVLIPIYNEAKSIGPLVSAIREKGFNVIVVDDGSSDGGGKLAEQSGARVLRSDARHGKGFSLVMGFEVIKEDYLGVIMMDGDGQHAVSDLDHFMATIKKDPRCLIVGNRMKSVKKMPLVRRWTNIVMSWLISMMCGQKIADTQCGFRYLNNEFLKSVKLESHAYEIETEILVKASRLKYMIQSVPIETIYEDETSKINPVIDTWRFLKFILKDGLCKKAPKKERV